MESRQFAEGYIKTFEPHEVHRGAHSAVIADAQEWSYDFGRMLHARLSGEESDTFTSRNDFTDYRNWAKRFPAMEKELLLTPNIGMRARNEVNFHAMNRHMIGMWDPITRGGWGSEAIRKDTITFAQGSLAVEGLFYYIARQNMVDQYGQHAMFQPATQELYARTSGIIQEMDAAIVLMDVVKQNPDLTVVPAPMQFERSREKWRNVDFVAVDTTHDRAVGVQVKTAVKQEDFDKSDKERVVYIDGTVDLGNVKAMRTQRGRSSERVVAWPGIIAAKRMALLKTHGKGLTQAGGSSRNLMVLKIEAERMVGNVQVDYRALSQIIGERILNSL